MQLILLLFVLICNAIKILSANEVMTFFIGNEPTFINGPGSLPRNPPDYFFFFFNICAFDNFTLEDEIFAKFLRLKTCLLVDNNSCRKFVPVYS